MMPIPEIGMARTNLYVFFPVCDLSTMERQGFLIGEMKGDNTGDPVASALDSGHRQSSQQQ